MWIAVLFVASLFVPALTKQWNDRQQELDVKQRLLSEIVAESADAVYGAQDVSFRTEPEQQLQARRQLLGAWLRDRIALEAPLVIYFEGSDVADHWWGGVDQLGFRNALLRYALLACDECDARETQASRVRKLRGYLEDADLDRKLSSNQWLRLTRGRQGSCSVDGAYCSAYMRLGNQLLAQRLVLGHQLLEANAQGFSSGWRDFVGDLNPLG